MTNTTVHEILDGLRPLIPGLWVLLLLAIYGFTIWFVTYFNFRRNLKFHLPEIAREEIEDRDRRVAGLEIEVTRLEGENEDYCQRHAAIMAFYHRAAEILYGEREAAAAEKRRRKTG